MQQGNYYIIRLHTWIGPLAGCVLIPVPVHDSAGGMKQYDPWQPVYDRFYPSWWGPQVQFVWNNGLHHYSLR
jgi:hypothetical protein